MFPPQLLLALRCSIWLSIASSLAGRNTYWGLKLKSVVILSVNNFRFNANFRSGGVVDLENEEIDQEMLRRYSLLSQGCSRADLPCLGSVLMNCGECYFVPLAKPILSHTSHSNDEDAHCLRSEEGLIMLYCRRFNIYNRLSHGAMKN